jgi:hypothetical protein
MQTINIQIIKLDLARRTWRGLNNILAGILLWGGFAVLGMILPDSSLKALVYLFGAGLLFPLGLLIGKLLKIDMFAQGNPLCAEQPVVASLATPPSAPAALETTVLSSPVEQAGAVYEPLPPEACEALREAMAEALGAEIALATGSFQDYITGRTGTSCQLTATGTGQEFPDLVEVAAQLGEMMTASGWTERQEYLVYGPTGTATAFQQEGNLCLVRVDWEPSAAVQCSSDQPISACGVPPEHQLYTIALERVQGAE